MNKRELIQLVAEKLGAANNEIKIAFDTFLQKVADNTEVESAIRIPEIGIFHLKKKDPHHDNYELLYLPLKYDPKGKNKIFSFAVKTIKQIELSEGESAFNISIGKPLIPIIGVNRRDFMVQSSYLMLQKTFEERADDLLARSVQLTDIKIDPRLIETDDEVIDFLEDYGQYEQLNDDTSDIPWDFGLSSEQNLYTEHSDAKDDITDQDEAIIDDTEIKIPDNELPDFKNAGIDEEPEKIDKDEPTDNWQDDLILKSEPPAVEGPLPDEENLVIEDKPEEPDIASIPIKEFYEEDSEQENLITEDSIKDLDDFKIDEADLGFTEAEKLSEISEYNETEYQPLSDTDNDEPEYDSTISVEADFDKSEYENPADELYTDDTLQQKEEEQEALSPRMDLITSFEPGRDYIREDEKPDFKVKYGLWFWVIMISFVIVTAGGLYYFLFYKDGNNQNTVQNNKTVEQNTVERDYEVPVSIIPQTDSAASEESNNQSAAEDNNVVNKPVEPKAEEQIPPVQNDIQTGDNKNNLVKEYIFSDGNKFTIQVSSWRTKSVAEDQVRRLQADGLPSYISEFISRNGQKWYRVRVGEYSSLPQAEEFLARNVNQLFK